MSARPFLRLEAFHITRREAKDVGKAGASGCAAPTALGAKNKTTTPLARAKKRKRERMGKNESFLMGA